MALTGLAAEIIIQEHLHRPLHGEVLLIGRQNTDITPRAMKNLLALYGLAPRVPLVLEKPGSMAHVTHTLAADEARIADVAVFHALADCRVSALDISDYEGAEIVHDLNQPLPEKFRNRFDFIFDGSVLDNVFNGAQALISMSEMLRPGGRALLYNAVNSAPTGYIQYSPEWFFDYFAANRYADCKMYIIDWPYDFEEITPPLAPRGFFTSQSGCWWHFDPVFVQDGKARLRDSGIKDGAHRYLYAVAEKAEDSTSSVPPRRHGLRGQDERVYLDSALRFRASTRPVFVPRTGEPFSAPSIGASGVLYPIARWTRRFYPSKKSDAPANEVPARIPAHVSSFPSTTKDSAS